MDNNNHTRDHGDFVDLRGDGGQGNIQQVPLPPVVPPPEKGRNGIRGLLICLIVVVGLSLVVSTVNMVINIADGRGSALDILRSVRLGRTTETAYSTDLTFSNRIGHDESIVGIFFRFWDYQHLHVQLLSYNIDMRVHDADSIHITTYPTNTRFFTHSNRTGNTITITEPLGASGGTVIIYVPREIHGMFGDISLQTVSGAINVNGDGGALAYDLLVNSVGGAITL